MPSEATSNTTLFLTIVAEYMATARTREHGVALGPLLRCPECICGVLSRPLKNVQLLCVCVCGR
jgi:hypothetical protein